MTEIQLKNLIIEHNELVGRLLIQSKTQPEIDLDVIRLLLTKTDRLINAIKNKQYKPLQINYEDEGIIFNAILKALEIGFEDMNNWELLKNKSKGMTESHLETMRISAKDIKQIITEKDLCPLESFSNKNIESQIGKILSEMGFVDCVRSSSGNRRIIDLDKLKAISKREVETRLDEPIILSNEDIIDKSVLDALTLMINEKRGKIETFEKILQHGKRKGIAKFEEDYTVSIPLTTNEIKETIITNNICEVSLFGDKNIYKEISRALKRMGFINIIKIKKDERIIIEFEHYDRIIKIKE